MTTNRPSIVRRLYTGLLPLTAQASARFVWMSNFEAERFWTDKKAVQLPRLSQPEDAAIINRLEETSLFLAEAPDLLILRERSDQEFLDYLTELGYRLPTILHADPPDNQTPIAEAVLANQHLCSLLSQSSPDGDRPFFLPYAKTALEEQIGEKAGLQCLGPRAEVCAKINSKVYSRTLSRELGLRTIKGWECESFGEIEAAFKGASRNLTMGQTLVLKESMGVSGKGLLIVDSERRAQQTLAMLKRKERNDSQFAFVLEQWVDKLKDINYQIFISASGQVELLAIKEIIAQKGVHLGHRFPPTLSRSQIECYEQAGQAIGERLFKEGYTGVVGIDSIIDHNHEIYPVLEINARFNMSTYQLGIERLIRPDAKVIAKAYPLQLKERLPFGRLIELIGPHLFRKGASDEGVIIQNFATVNANNDSSGQPFKGRLYLLLMGEDDHQLARLDRIITGRLNPFQSPN